MTVTRFQTCGNIINRVAVEAGLTPVTDVFSTSDVAFKQLGYLLTTCVQELMELHTWQRLIRNYSYTTGAAENGPLDLPADFGYMIPQTGWERSSNVPLIGPLSPQSWSYLLGRDLVGSTIYASIRFDQDKLYVFPSTPMPANAEITFEYVSRNVIEIADTDPQEYTDEAAADADTVVFPPHLITRMLKMKFLEAKGFDTRKATDDFNNALDSHKGKDNGATVLTLGRRRFSGYFLDGFRSVPDTGFGT